ELRSILVNAEGASPTVGQAVANLPVDDPTGGALFVLTSAEEKALGLQSGSSLSVDGYIGLSSSSTFDFHPNSRAAAGAYDAVGVLEHEISHALGRITLTSEQVLGVPVDMPLDLFRYTGPNARTFLPGTAYFSLDNGVTKLKTFDDG